MYLSEGVVVSEYRLGSEAFPRVVSHAGLSVDRSFSFLCLTSVVALSVLCVISQSEVLAEGEVLEELYLHKRATEVVGSVELVDGAAHICTGVGGEPVELVGCGGVHIRAVSRREEECRAHHAGVEAQRVGKVGHRGCEALIGAHLKPVGHLARDVGTQCITLISRVFDYTFLVGIVAREAIVAAVVAAAHINIIVLLEGILEDLVLPVGSAELCGIAIFVVEPSSVAVVFWRTGVFSGVVVWMSVGIILIAPCSGIRQRI